MQKRWYGPRFIDIYIIYKPWIRPMGMTTPLQMYVVRRHVVRTTAPPYYCLPYFVYLTYLCRRFCNTRLSPFVHRRTRVRKRTFSSITQSQIVLEQFRKRFMDRNDYVHIIILKVSPPPFPWVRSYFSGGF